MAKHEPRIWEKLDEWTAAGLISSAQAAAIRASEPAPKSTPPWGIMIFACSGAVVLGMGVILLFAYNWDQMHKFGKLAIIFTALAAAHTTGIILRSKNLTPGFADAAFLLGSMIFGAGIWLVAQIYHISAHYPNAFVVWAIGALLFAWLLPSVAQGLLAAVMISVWACCEAVSYDSHPVAAPLLVLVGTGWLAWRMRSPVLLAVAAVSFVVSMGVGLVFHAGCVMVVLLGTTLILESAAWLARDCASFPAATRILHITGMILYLPVLFILTFHDAAEDLLRNSYWSDQPPPHEWLPLVVLILAVLGLYAGAGYRAVTEQRFNTQEFRSHLLAPSLIFTAYLIAWWAPLLSDKAHFTYHSNAATMLCAAANALFIYRILGNLWAGCRNSRLRQVVGGSLLLAVWIFARFADLFDSLLVRGTMFMVMGAGLFAVAVIYQRNKSHLPAVTNPLNPGKED